MRPMGGSDIMEIGLKERLNPEEYNINLILSRCTEELIVPDKINILWQHLNYNEPYTKGMQNKFFIRAIDAFVYVSHWQYEKFRYVYQCPVDNAHVVKNAIEPIEYSARSKGEKFKLIYTSAPFRGLKNLLDAFSIIGRDDVELHVYSSTMMYGTEYDLRFKKHYDDLFERAKNMKNVVYHGYAPNKQIIEALKTSHIFAYPSVFEETCCLAMIEAGAAGCRLIAHNLGALLETGSEYATLVPIRINEKKIAEEYANALNNAINTYYDCENVLQKQSDYFNAFYSWENIIPKWKQLFESFS